MSAPPGIFRSDPKHALQRSGFDRYRLRSGWRVAAVPADLPDRGMVHVGSCAHDGRVMTGRRFPLGVRLLPALGVVAAALTLPLALATAAEPSPSPVVFTRPQYLIWMEGHSTSNGPVVDRVYWLYTHPPDGDGTHFAVPDGSGLTFHYQGALIGGPFSSDVEACPAMLARGITSLTTWPPGQYEKVADCRRFLPGEAGAAGAGAGGSGGTASGAPGAGLQGAAGSLDPARVGAAAAGVALAAAGAAGLLRTGRRPRTPDPGGDQTTDDEQPDPCAEQQGDYDAASARVAVLSDLLQTNRRLVALVDRQVIQLANVMIPGSFGLDVAFILGGQWGSKIGWGIVPKEILGKALDSVVKDIVKDIAKQALDAAGRSALDLSDFEARIADAALKGGEGGTKGLLKEILKLEIQGRQSSRLFSTASGSPEQLKARLTMLKDYQNLVTGPAVDTLSHVMSMYNAGIGVATLMEKLEILRIRRDTMLDATAELEVEHESAVNDARTAHDRLEYCRRVNSPDWRP